MKFSQKSEYFWTFVVQLFFLYQTMSGDGGDGASCHVTPACLDFLKSKFGTRVISRKTEHIWPPYSPDLSPMDFSFWSYVLSHVIRCQPATIQELKMIVSDFISNMEPDYLRKIARQTRRRAEFCVSQNGGHFEHLLKKKCN